MASDQQPPGSARGTPELNDKLHGLALDLIGMGIVGAALYGALTGKLDSATQTTMFVLASTYLGVKGGGIYSGGGNGK